MLPRTLAHVTMTVKLALRLAAVHFVPFCMKSVYTPFKANECGTQPHLHLGFMYSWVRRVSWLCKIWRQMVAIRAREFSQM